MQFTNIQQRSLGQSGCQDRCCGTRRTASTRWGGHGGCHGTQTWRHGDPPLEWLAEDTSPALHEATKVPPEKTKACGLWEKKLATLNTTPCPVSNDHRAQRLTRPWSSHLCATSPLSVGLGVDRQARLLDYGEKVMSWVDIWQLFSLNGLGLTHASKQKQHIGDLFVCGSP